ncbi:hypothetical protein LguiB_032215 [Lonicera macranthoides]
MFTGQTTWITGFLQSSFELQISSKNREEILLAITKLQNILAKHQYRNIKWVMFHGLYNLAYTVKIMTGLPLPDTLTGFHSLLGDVFGSITDVKFIA